MNREVTILRLYLDELVAIAIDRSEQVGQAADALEHARHRAATFAKSARSVRSIQASLSSGERADVGSAIDSLRDAVDDARIEASVRMKRARQACDFAERFARFTARAVAGDVDENDLRIVASALEQIAGVQIDVAFMKEAA